MRSENMNPKIIIVVFIICIIILILSNLLRRHNEAKRRARRRRQNMIRQQSTYFRPNVQDNHRQQTPDASSGKTSYSRINLPTAVVIKKLHDDADEKVNLSSERKQMVRGARNYQGSRRSSYRTKNQQETISIDMNWVDDLAELIEATEVVYTNAEMNCNRRLQSEKFQYYCHLHFRSFTAADLCHERADMMKRVYDDINKTILRLKSAKGSQRVSEEDYSKIIEIKNVMKTIIPFLYKRCDELNLQTRVLKLKIRDECGNGGREWYERLESRAKG